MTATPGVDDVHAVLAAAGHRAATRHRRVWTEGYVAVRDADTVVITWRGDAALTAPTLAELARSLRGGGMVARLEAGRVVVEVVSNVEKNPQ